MKKNLCLAVLFFLSFTTTWADIGPVNSLVSIASTTEDFKYPDYYLIKNDPRVAIVDLLNFDHIQSPFPQPAVPYNRKLQFGTWIDLPGDQLCLNTRAFILVRESKSPVTYTANGCTVKTGQWMDPYTGSEFQSSLDIQIDHFVPLKHAYMTGAFEWNQNKRCLYANYLGNNFHLLAVNSRENEKKSDSSPVDYVPPNENYKCEYLKHWLQIKVIWQLRITPREMNAIMQKIDEGHCDHADFKMTTGDLISQRHFMDDNMDLCQRPAMQTDLAVGF